MHGMERPRFLALADDVIGRVENWLMDFDPDEVDFTSADGVIKIQFPDGRTYVLNRQTAADQMWYAAGVRAWHYVWNEEKSAWHCDKDGHELFDRVRMSLADKLERHLEPIP